MSITHSKKRILLLNLLINRISVRSAPLKDENTFRFSNVLIIGLCNSSLNCHGAKPEGR